MSPEEFERRMVSASEAGRLRRLGSARVRHLGVDPNRVLISGVGPASFTEVIHPVRLDPRRRDRILVRETRAPGPRQAWLGVFSAARALDRLTRPRRSKPVD